MLGGFELWAAALFTFLGVLINGTFNFFLRRGKQNSDNNQQLIQNVFTQIGMLQNRVEVLENEREELLDELKDLMDELNAIKLENAELRAENKILKQKVEDLENKNKSEN